MLGRMMVAWALMVLASVALAADSANLTLADIPQCGVCDPLAFLELKTFTDKRL